MLQQQSVLPGTVVIDDAAHHHRPKPFSDVPLVQVSRPCDFATRGPVSASQYVKQSHVMPNAYGEPQKRRVEDVDHALLEGSGLRRVNGPRRHRFIPFSNHRTLPADLASLDRSLLGTV